MRVPILVLPECLKESDHALLEDSDIRHNWDHSVSEEELEEIFEEQII